MNYISNNIRYLRKRNKLTQNDLAKIVNKSRTLVSQWESDDREITVGDIVKLSNYFKVPMDRLIAHNLELEKETDDELDELYNQHRQNLSERDKSIMKAILKESKKEK